MLLINADDFGRSVAETDAALTCFHEGLLTSVSAMAFMNDSARAAELARIHSVPVGLHLNLVEEFTGPDVPTALRAAQREIVHFLRKGRLAPAVYHPGLRQAFAKVCQAQLSEFRLLYRSEPVHVDGHQHMHLCANVVYSRLLPEGIRVRRNFSFLQGEKSAVNRAYRRSIDWQLARSHPLTDFFLDLSEYIAPGDFGKVLALASESSVELMTHPVQKAEFDFLMEVDRSVVSTLCRRQARDAYPVEC